MSDRPVSRFHDYLAQRQPMPTLADAAIALGVPVFPCLANKKPVTIHGFKDASADPAVIRRMFQNPAAVMIGVPTGAVTGWIVVDVDVKDGAQGAAWLDANSHRMVQTRTIRTGSGGLHLYFRWPDQPVKNSVSKIAPGIDVRGDGGYVIVPPSPGYAIADNAPIADTPDWLLPAILPPAVEAAPATLLPQRRLASDTSRLGRSTLEQRCDEIRFASDGTKHRAINEAAFAVGGLVHAGHYTEAEAIAALRDALSVILPRCKDARAAEKTLHRAFREGVNKPQNVEPPTEDLPLAPAVWNITQTMLARRKVQAAPTPPLAVSPDLMDVPGALRLFIDHCERTAMSPQPFLALAAGICLVGALAGRRYRTSTDLRTNIYAIGVADSGAGKDHARKQIVRCLYAANLAHYLGGGDVASGAGLRSAIQRHPSMLFQIDEFGDWLTGVLGEKASTHKKQIASMLKELYSSAAGPWQGTEYADQSRDKGKPKFDIHQPNACLYGTTTPGQFWSAVAGTSLHDGLLARMLLFVSPCSYPDERDPDLSDPSHDLVAALQAIAAGPGGTGNLGALMLASTVPEPMTVPETPEAATARRALRQDQLKQQRKHEGTYVTAIAGRLAENAMKLALVRAVSRDPAAPVISSDDVAWGRAVAQHCVDTLLREAAQNVGDTDYQRKVNQALSYIRKHGPLTARDMMRKGWMVPSKEREEILHSLVESGRAIAIAHPSAAIGGRPTIKYAAPDTTGFVSGTDDA